MKSLKKNRKKGFTLVELIVVLVILAILAALLVPALTKYIDKAKQKQVVAETRSCVMAAQTLADEAYAKGETVDDTTIDNDDITDLAEVSGTITSKEFEDGHVKSLTYEHSSGLVCTYSWEATKGGTYDPE